MTGCAHLDHDQQCENKMDRDGTWWLVAHALTDINSVRTRQILRVSEDWLHALWPRSTQCDNKIVPDRTWQCTHFVQNVSTKQNKTKNYPDNICWLLAHTLTKMNSLGKRNIPTTSDDCLHAIRLRFIVWGTKCPDSIWWLLARTLAKTHSVGNRMCWQYLMILGYALWPR